MNAIRKSAWSIVILGMAVGCAGEDESVPPPAAAKANYPSRPAPRTGKSSRVRRSRNPGNRRKADEPPAVEGPKAENSSRTATADGRRARRHQGITRGRTGRGEPASRLPGEHTPSWLNG